MSQSEPRMVVLVVEDQTLVRMFMADFLDEAGFKVFEAVNADEALTVLQARPDVQAVVTDIEMPAGAARRSGWQLIGNQDEMRGRCRFFLRGARAATV
jgi:CheY-like chemotaxis protein